LFTLQNDIVIPLSSFNISSVAELIHYYTNESESGRDLSSLSKMWVESASSIDSANSRKLPPKKEKRKGFSIIKEITGASGSIEIEPPLDDDKEEDRAELLDDEYRSVLVKSITSEQLVNLIEMKDRIEERHPLFVMFTAKFCGMCGVGLASFLELSRFLSSNYDAGLNVTFVKVDVFKNSLPEELSPENVPTFVYFPPDK
jgi:hypothetical protein